MPSLVVLYLRSDVAWGRLTEDTYVDQQKYSTAVLPIGQQRKQELLERIRLWNRCFALSYFEYRQGLKDIADWGRSRITHVDLVVKNRHHVGLLSRFDNAVILPTDDDDWFAPHLVECLRNFTEAGTDLIRWSDAIYCPTRSDVSANGRTSVFPRGASSEFFWTNSYAITSQGLNRCPAEHRARALDRHATTLRTFGASVENVRLQPLQELLSVTLKSPASFTKLKDLDSPAKMLGLVPRLLQRSTFLPPACVWAEPLIRQVEDLNGRLANSAKNPHRQKVAHRPLSRAAGNTTIWLTPPLSRTNVINSVARRFGYRSYLEIGCGNNRNFEQVTLPVKIGVDPRQGGTHRMTSDVFFPSNTDRFDLIFIDGLHLAEQVLRDIAHSLCVLNDGGCVLIHDCLPTECAQQERNRTTAAWTGDVWKAVVNMRSRDDVDVAVLNQCWGLGALFHRRNTARLTDVPELTWDTYMAQRGQLLRVLDPPRFERFLAGEPLDA